MAPEPRAREGLDTLLRALKLPVFVELRASLAARAETEGWRFEEYLHQLATHEAQDRKRRRIDRLVKLSGVPKDKTLAALKLDRLSTPVRRLLPTLCEGGFVERAENVLAFGLPGRGKTHVLCAIANELLLRGYKVLFTPAYRLVQRLLVAKRALALERELRALTAAMQERGIASGTVVTLDDDERIDTSAGPVQVVPAWRWLLRPAGFLGPQAPAA